MSKSKAKSVKRVLFDALERAYPTPPPRVLMWFKWCDPEPPLNPDNLEIIVIGRVDCSLTDEQRSARIAGREFDDNNLEPNTDVDGSTLL